MVCPGIRSRGVFWLRKGRENLQSQALCGESCRSPPAPRQGAGLQPLKGGGGSSTEGWNRLCAALVLAVKQAGLRGGVTPPRASAPTATAGCGGRHWESRGWWGRGAACGVQDAQGPPLPVQGWGMAPLKQSPCGARRRDELVAVSQVTTGTGQGAQPQ